MLKKQFDFQVASFENLQEVSLEEVRQADLIEIREYVKGGIYHSQSFQWFGSLVGVTTVQEFIRSKKERKVLAENKEWFEKKGCRFEIKKMTKTLFNEFYEVYKSTTLVRERPLTFSLKEQILGKVLIKMPVYLIGLYKKKRLVSGLVFSVSDDNFAVVSFGAKKKFPELRGGVGGVFESLLLEYCLEHNITQISHGKSKNPMGITTKSGVFEFKARYGFSAFPAGEWKTTFVVNPKIALSDLVFVTIMKNQLGYLVVSDTSEKEVIKKYQTRVTEQIQRVTPKDLQKAAKKFIAQLK